MGLAFPFSELLGEGRLKGGIMIVIHRILVATDFGAESDTALRYGRALARSFGAALHVLHVTENVYGRGMDVFAAIPPHVQREIEEAARAQTEALLADDDRRELKAVAVTVTHNSPPAAIVEYARDKGIDLIVLGTHGRGAVAHVFLGNVAERVVRTAPCPVLTVRRPEREIVVPDALVAASRQAAG